MTQSKTFQSLMTIGFAAIGTLIFLALHLPLPFLFGPMAASLVSALLGAPLRGIPPVSVAARTVLGVASGAAFTPALIAGLPQMLLSLSLVPLFIFLVGLIGVPFFRRVWNFDAPTAYYSAMPGGFQDMVLLGIEAGGNARALSLIQATRVLIIVTLAPMILAFFYGTDLSKPIGDPISDLPLRDIALMIAAAFFGLKIAQRLNLFGATILGPLAAAALLSLTGVLDTRPPREAILASQFFIGCGIGVHFKGVTLRELQKIISAGIAFVVLLSALAIGFSALVAKLGLNDPVATFLAFAPGGQAEMTVLAIVTGADLGVVATHHLTRMICVIIGAPLFARLISGPKPED